MPEGAITQIMSDKVLSLGREHIRHDLSYTYIHLATLFRSLHLILHIHVCPCIIIYIIATLFRCMTVYVYILLQPFSDI